MKLPRIIQRRRLLRSREPHQIINDGIEELVFYIIADNPVGDSCYYPDSDKWGLPSNLSSEGKSRRLLRRRRHGFHPGHWFHRFHRKLFG